MFRARLKTPQRFHDYPAYPEYSVNGNVCQINYCYYFNDVKEAQAFMDAHPEIPNKHWTIYGRICG